MGWTVMLEDRLRNWKVQHCARLQEMVGYEDINLFKVDSYSIEYIIHKCINWCKKLYKEIQCKIQLIDE